MQSDHKSLGSDFNVARVIQIDKEDMSLSHIHPYCEINLCLSGSSLFTFIDRTYDVYPGTLVFIDSFVNHKNLRHSDYERAWLLLPEESVRVIEERLSIGFRNYLGDKVMVLSLGMEETYQEVKNILLSIEAEFRNKDVFYAERILLLLCDLIIFLIRNEQIKRVPRDVIDKNTLVYNIAHYLTTHCNEQITLSVLSEQFFIEKTHLCKSFKKELGLTIWEYLMIQRIHRACQILSNTSDKIIEVAHATGFRTISHFERTFKKIAGCNPTQYRKRSLVIQPRVK